MKLIEPSFKILTPFGECTPEIGVMLLRHIEAMARISHRSEDRQTEDSWKRFIETIVIQHGDWSVTEHASLTVVCQVDRGVTHELVRHRLFSFTQESTRFVNYGKLGKELEFIRPANAPFPLDSWNSTLRLCEEEYFDLLNAGWRPQEARSVLPNALAARIAITGNLRNWRWFFLARTTKETHPDFLRLSLPLLNEFKKLIPLLYDDIEPLQKQSISMGKVH
jgi:thymidylate synthase (FAD)